MRHLVARIPFRRSAVVGELNHSIHDRSGSKGDIAARGCGECTVWNHANRAGRLCQRAERRRIDRRNRRGSSHMKDRAGGRNRRSRRNRCALHYNRDAGRNLYVIRRKVCEVQVCCRDACIDPSSKHVAGAVAQNEVVVIQVAVSACDPRPIEIDADSRETCRCGAGALVIVIETAAGFRRKESAAPDISVRTRVASFRANVDCSVPLNYIAEDALGMAYNVVG